jgi:hypothetical protein
MKEKPARGTVGDLKRALANIPDDVYVIIPRDSDDGGAAYEAYWDGNPEFLHGIEVRNDEWRWGIETKRIPFAPGDELLFLGIGDDYSPPRLVTSLPYVIDVATGPHVKDILFEDKYISHMSPVTHMADGWWTCMDSKTDLTAAEESYETEIARFPGRPTRLVRVRVTSRDDWEILRKYEVTDVLEK